MNRTRKAIVIINADGSIGKITPIKPPSTIRRKESSKDPYKEFNAAAKAKHYRILSATWHDAVKMWEVLVAYNPPPPVLPGERKQYKLRASKWQGIIQLIKDLK